MKIQDLMILFGTESVGEKIYISTKGTDSTKVTQLKLSIESMINAKISVILNDFNKRWEFELIE